MLRDEIRLAGAGGQGIVTAGRILAEAAILSGKSATQSQLYGPQSRGGASRTDVVIAEGDIGFPLADDPGFLVILSEEAYARYRHEAGENCVLVIDSHCPNESPNGRTRVYPLADTARALSGGQLVTGVIALGVLQASASLVDLEALLRAVEAKVPPRHKALNFKALEAGVAMVGEA